MSKVERLKLFIDGEFVNSGTSEYTRYTTSRGEVIAEAPLLH